MRYNVYLQTITYARKFFTNHGKNCTKNVHIIFLHLAPHSDTDTVRLCQYTLSACELPIFELCFNVSLVQILFEYILLFSMHDMTDSFVIHKYC